nr:hypothetical protein [Mycoplasmoides pneumoniae]
MSSISIWKNETRNRWVFLKWDFIWLYWNAYFWKWNSDKNQTLENQQKTTRSKFGEIIHTYTMSDALDDENVLCFRYKSYYIKDDGSRIDTLNEERIKHIVDFTLDKYLDATQNTPKFDNFENPVKEGFNSIFACESKEAAIEYYKEFKKQIEQKKLPIKIASIIAQTKVVMNKKLV